VQSYDRHGLLADQSLVVKAQACCLQLSRPKYVYWSNLTGPLIEFLNGSPVTGLALLLVNRDDEERGCRGWLAIIKQSNFGHVLFNEPLYDVLFIVAICPQQRRYETAHVRPPIHMCLGPYPKCSHCVSRRVVPLVVIL